MHINLEAADAHAVQSYSDNSIQIDSIVYKDSLIVSRKKIITDLTIKNISDIKESCLKLLLEGMPELILIGHKETGVFPPVSIINTLAQQKIGFECMSLGAACRTYNILLSEGRSVTACFIL